MDLPVEEWKSYILRKWSLLPASVRVTISIAETLSDVFLQCSPLLQPEDELFLQRLSRGLLVGKDPKASIFYKEEGNKKFQEKDYMGAAVLYTKGVSHAAPNTEDISLCYANRSVTLFHLGHYETCLEDIIRAQRHGYPERLQPKMMFRKAECLVALGRLQEAHQTISNLENIFSAKPTLAVSHSQILQRKLPHLKTKLAGRGNLSETFPASLTKALKDMDLKEENEQIPGVSSSVTLCADPLKGRYLIATKDILPGELLVKEDAFVSALSPGEMSQLHPGPESKWDTKVTHRDLHCHQCLKHTLAMVPCDECSYAKYCSQECRQQAWELYHSVECPQGALLLTLGIFCQVALRATLLARFENVEEILRKLGREIRNKDVCLPESKNYGREENEENDQRVETPIPGCDIHGKYEKNYSTVFSLLPHTENHSPEHKFLCALSIAALCKRLEAARPWALVPGQKASPAKAAAAPGLPAEVNVWGVLMLRHVLQLQCNAQAITTIQQTGSNDSNITESRQVRLATALFPAVSLLNHSCCPNTSISFFGTVATLRASQRIGKGQEVLHCYDSGGAVLRCGSASCTESLRRDHLVSCLQDLQKQVDVAQALLRNGQLEQAVQRLLGSQRAAEGFLSAEHALVGEIEDSLAQAYAALGDWQKSATHLQKSLRVVEARHGPSSIEMGHELFKLAQVFFNGLAAPEALDTIRRAEAVLGVHCGPRSEEIQELQKMKSCLLDLPPIPVGPSGEGPQSPVMLGKGVPRS
ncbi:SET and MYND domain-containing protein 4 [Echinops telfairi]|uniref:Protein-lysine N-methyltransferase SMYD4 n=1 Tax=Echinops telfairi TaxID=9371 RepID=A0ABM0ZRF9_ECHTE|nr:SET and MYND domain-containing protein 4 [Echinops telfairi]